ncbi:MAG: diguanylate cyclase [Acidimicrobiia bacterium]
MVSAVFAAAPSQGDLAWFWVTTSSASLCACVSTVVVAAGVRRRLAEVGLLGTGLLMISLWAIVGGILGPGPLYDNAPSAHLAMLAGFPMAVAACAPLLAPRSRWATALAHRWTVSAAVALTVTVAGSAALLTRPDSSADLAIVRPIALIVTAIGGTLLTRRQWYLHQIARTRPSAVAASAIGALTITAVWAQATSAGSAAAWIAVGVDNAGVLASAAALLAGYRQHRSLARVLAPVMRRNPIGGFEAGLAPEVRAFVAALERKDPVTEHHVIRTSAMALRLAERAKLSPDRIRSVGLGALLHDIGKLVIPSDILNKPGELTDAEYATIKTHPEQGEALLRHTPGLHAAAQFVRGHHERPDGRGYPDGLNGAEVSLEVSIVSACDAWDAMTNTRQYRQGMDIDRVRSIMLEGSGTQWHHRAVELLLAEVEVHGAVAEHDALESAAFGAEAFDAGLVECACSDALPAGADDAAHLEPTAVRPSDDLLRLVFESAPIGMALMCPRGTLVEMNAALTALTGAEPSDVIGTVVARWLHVDDRERFNQARRRSFASLSVCQERDLRLQRPDGEHRVVDVSLRTIDEPGAGPCVLMHVVDRTESARLHGELETLAHTDELTGMRNRRGLLRDGGTALDVTSRGRGDHQMVFVDVDSLKSINDSFGHAAGDEALIEVATSITVITRTSDVAARIGGDEFCILLPDAEHDAATRLVQRLREEIDRRNVERDRPWTLSVSVGLATADPDARPRLQNLIDDADRSLYSRRNQQRRVTTSAHP